MSEAPEHDEALDEEDIADKDLSEVHARALKRFDLAVTPQLEQRGKCLEARRFASIPGAMWEGDWADTFPEALRLEINLVSEGLEKIQRDYNENRIVPDFRPAGGKGDVETAKTLDGLHRANSWRFKAQQARDNAFNEASAGGMGAWRLTNEWADPYDKDNDHQVINPGLTIADADQRVFFDPDSELIDKSDARFAFVLTSKARETFEDQYDGCICDWPDPKLPGHDYDWFTPDTITIAEYYEVEEKDDRILIFTQTLSGEEQRWWKSEIEPEEIDDLKAKGWMMRSRAGKRRRVVKYVLSGAEVLKGPLAIAGDCIPVVVVYGKRWFIDGIERFSGYVQERMDRQRLYNAQVSRLAEVNAQASREIPIFAASQMPPALSAMWERQVVDRHAYALVEPLIDPASGQIISAGPIGSIQPPQLEPVTAALIQIARQDILEGQQDGADAVKANTSADALDAAATRVDARSGIYLDHMRQAVQREGEIWLSMSSDVYFEPGREVETMTEDGDDGLAKLQERVTDPKTSMSSIRNDFRRGAFKVVTDVTEATATRRDKTVKSALRTAEVAVQVQDMELAQAALITAISNQDGEGMTELQKYARNRGLQSGLFEPTDEEKAEMDAAAEGQGPDPQSELIGAQVDALTSQATKDKAQAEKLGADKKLSEARAVETLAGLGGVAVQ